MPPDLQYTLGTIGHLFFATSLILKGDSCKRPKLVNATHGQHVPVTGEKLTLDEQCMVSLPSIGGLDWGGFGRFAKFGGFEPHGQDTPDVHFTPFVCFVSLGQSSLLMQSWLIDTEFQN